MIAQSFGSTSREVGLEREIKLSRQAADTFDAAEDLIARQNQAIARDFETSG